MLRIPWAWRGSIEEVLRKMGENTIILKRMNRKFNVWENNEDCMIILRKPRRKVVQMETKIYLLKRDCAN